MCIHTASFLFTSNSVHSCEYKCMGGKERTRFHNMLPTNPHLNPTYFTSQIIFPCSHAVHSMTARKYDLRGEVGRVEVGVSEVTCIVEVNY